jgi:hypothetical protein
MNGLERRIQKMEKAAGISDKLSFHSFLRELLNLINGRTRGLPSQRKEEDPQFHQTCEALSLKYSCQASEEGRRRFEEDLVNFNNRLCNEETDTKGQNRFMRRQISSQNQLSESG